MVMPQQGQPGVQGGMLPPGIEAAVQQLPPEVQGVARTLPPEILIQLLSLPLPQQVELLQEALQAQRMGIVGPSGQPMPPGGSVGASPVGMGGPPPPMGLTGAPPPQSPLPSPVGPGGPPPTTPPGPPPPDPLTPPETAFNILKDMQRESGRPKPPDPDIPPLPDDRGKPDMGLVWDDTTTAESIYRERDDMYEEVGDLYYLRDWWQKVDGGPVNQPGGDVMVTRAQPATMVDRGIGLVAPSNDRLTWHVDYWSDDPEVKSAATNIRNALRHWRDQDIIDWHRRSANDGLTMPDLPRVEAGNLLLEGAIPFFIDLDPERPSNPHVYEPFSPHEVYPLHHATLRIQRTTLNEARKQWKKVKDKFRDSKLSAETTCKVVTWSDERWWCVAFILGDDPDMGKQTSDGVWIRPPKKHDLGFRKIQSGVTTFGTPLSPMTRAANDVQEHVKYRWRGILHTYLPMFRLMNQLMSATATLAFRQAAQALVLEDPNGFGEPEVNDGPGGITTLKMGQKLYPLIATLAGTEDGRQLLQSIMADLGEAAPPVMAGRGQAESGADRFMATQQAAALHIDPAIDAIEKHFQYLGTLRLEAVWRKGTGKDAWVGKMPVRSKYADSETDDGDEYTGMGVVSPEDVEKNGTLCRVRYQRYSLAEWAQLGGVLNNMIKAGLMTKFEALDRLNVEDPARMLRQVFYEKSLEAPEMIKSIITTALWQESHPELTEEEREIQKRDALWAAWETMVLKSQPKGSDPATPGDASLPATPGVVGLPGAMGTPAPGGL